MRYDPMIAPEAEAWLSLDDDEKLAGIEEFHLGEGEDFEGMKVHCVIHEIVENQVALGEELPVRAKLDQLMEEGLDRHEAVHAVGMVLSGYLFDLMESGAPPADASQEYFDELSRLTAETYRSEFEDS